MQRNGDIITATVCPYCGYKLNDATGVDDSSSVPRPGDISVCLDCGGVLLFDAKVMAIVIPDSVWANLDSGLKEQILKVSKQIRLFRMGSDARLHS